MIGLVVAMDDEIHAIKKYFESCDEVTYHGVTFYVGKVAGIDVVMAEAGIGKVNAALSATMLCEKFRPDVMISTGIAGGLGRSGVLDVVIADRVVQHDFDTTPLGDPKGIISSVDAKVLNALKVILPRAKVGTVATGDQFVCDTKIANSIVSEFDGFACDMECGAVARVAEVYGVPFGAIKVISDGGNDGAELTFAEMRQKAGEMNGNTVYEFIKAY